MTMLDIPGRHTHTYDRHTHSPSGHTHSPASHLSNGHTHTHPIKPAAAAMVSSQRCSSTSLQITSMYLITTGTAGSNSLTSPVNMEHYNIVWLEKDITTSVSRHASTHND